MQDVVNALSSKREEESLYRPMTEDELLDALAAGRNDVDNLNDDEIRCAVEFYEEF